MITRHQWALLYRAKCITEIPQHKSPKQICLVLGEIWGVGIIPEAAGSPRWRQERQMQRGIYCAAVGICKRKRRRFRAPQEGTAKSNASKAV